MKISDGKASRFSKNSKCLANEAIEFDFLEIYESDMSKDNDAVLGGICHAKICFAKIPLNFQYQNCFSFNIAHISMIKRLFF